MLKEELNLIFNDYDFTDPIVTERTQALLNYLMMIKEHDIVPYMHSCRSCLLTKCFCMYLGCYSREEITRISEGALLHDLGKVLIPLEILIKPGRLTDLEYDEIKKHSMYGYNLLTKDCLKNIRHILRSNHEKLDGSGYPDHLVGDQIAKDVRTVSICEVFDTLGSIRPYKKALSIDESLRIMKEASGTQFDADLLKCFFKFVGENMELVQQVLDITETKEVDDLKDKEVVKTLRFPLVHKGKKLLK